MKNIFKLMGIALIASSMALVSCSKDDDATINVTFGDESWSCSETMEYAGDFAIFKDADAKVATVQFTCLAAVGKYDINGTTAYVVYNADQQYNTFKDGGFIEITDFSLENKKISGDIQAELAIANTQDYKALTVSMKDAAFDILTK